MISKSRRGGIIRLATVTLIMSVATKSTAVAEESYVQAYADRDEIEVSSASGIKLNLEVHGSYCCTLRDYGERQPPSNGFNFSPQGSEFTRLRNFAGEQVPFTNAGGLSPSVGTSLGPHRSRACFTVTEFGATGVAPYYLDIDREELSSRTTVKCEETTLLSGYNTFSSDFLFLELVAAQRSAAIPVQVTVLASNGSKAFETQVLVKTRSDLSLNTLLGTQPDIGAVILTANAPRGAIKAFLAEYRADRSNRRSGLTLVGRQEFSPRRD